MSDSNQFSELTEHTVAFQMNPNKFKRIQTISNDFKRIQ